VEVGGLVAGLGTLECSLAGILVVARVFPDRLVALVLLAAVVLTAALTALPAVRAWAIRRRPSHRTRRVFYTVCSAAILTVASWLGTNWTSGPGCSAPTEVRVLTSQESVNAIAQAATDFEAQQISSGGHCAPVHFDVYAAADENSVDNAFTSGLSWQGDQQNGVPSNQQPMSLIGPRPDVWIPESRYEVEQLHSRPPKAPQAVFADGDQPVSGTDPGRPVASSPLVVAVPPGVPLPAGGEVPAWSVISDWLSARNLQLALPAPKLSYAGSLQAAAMLSSYRSQQAWRTLPFGTGAEEAATSSQALLCTGLDSAAASRTAFLVSEAAMESWNKEQAQGSVCPADRHARDEQLRAVYPANAKPLDFPYLTVRWHGDDSMLPGSAKYRWASAFRQWLTRTPGELNASYLRSGDKWCGSSGGDLPQRIPALPCPQPIGSQPLSDTLQAIDASKEYYGNVRGPARILVAVDDSDSMGPDLPGVDRALRQLLGPGGSSFGSEDAFGLWSFPSARGATEQQLTSGLITPGGDAARSAANAAGRITAVAAPSADYAALAAGADAVSAPGHRGSILMITNGDGYRIIGRPEATGAKEALTALQLAGVAAHFLAYGPNGCTADLSRIATLSGGDCHTLGSADPTAVLSQLIDQLTGGT
jgi:hypothetical protein